MDVREMRRRKDFFLDKVNRDIKVYLMNEPDEDEAICELYFRKGEEEQRKTIWFSNPNTTGNECIHTVSAKYLLERSTCKNCRTLITLLDNETLKEAKLSYCPYCGEKLEEYEDGED